ncbi:hypothetical protein FEDK69T_07080 [Flavobacterium enshiense DK69]|uniref:Uncharacterized protein n=1 Tax=Flavobacterium enshiense DK69 TaxID=1107311 RepID=V6SDD9_9FLAO|nr:hypothetical protein [Flavobacterium enshiense]ESU24267.1 hypothetical protein FEDK69T_07080 [Flavobacterium enshiense DK69]KGO95359.1 hypothetical protein Q767_11165 [Flavobacterium enshiense DK69]
MRNAYLITTLLLCFSSQAQSNAVGIGTTNPQQKLHLDKTVGTLRVESLDKDNNTTNGGNVTPTATYPLYVDHNGILTLKLGSTINSDGVDAIDHAIIPACNIRMFPADADGKVDATIFTYTLTVPRAAILEVKYSVSFQVYEKEASGVLTMIRDGGARRVSTYYTVDNLPRKYGQASRNYMNNNTKNPLPYTAIDRLGAVGNLYNSSTTYVQLTPGTHTLQLKAEVSSNLPAMYTYVKMAIDTDSVFMRLY